MRNKEIDSGRLFLYNTLSLLFVEEHVKNRSEEIVENLKVLAQQDFDADVSAAVNDILVYLSTTDLSELYIHFQELFLVPFGENISLSASWYHEEREGGTMLVKVRDILAKTKIRKDENTFKAPEDNFGFIFTLCAYLIEEQLNKSIKEDLQKELFVEVVNPYVDNLFYKLLSSKSQIYASVGVILANIMAFDRAYLEIKK